MRRIAFVSGLVWSAACSGDGDVQDSASSFGSGAGTDSDGRAETSTSDATSSGGTASGSGSTSTSGGETGSDADSGADGSSSEATSSGETGGTDSDGIATDGEPPQPCGGDEDCDDMLFCSGIETCEGGFCVAGAPVVCDDSVECTNDVCDESGMECIHVPFDADCANDDLCDGIESCDPVMGCQAGIPLDCDDLVDCTVDVCVPASGCESTPDHVACSNDVFCDGDEVCDPVSNCIPGPERACADTFACTTDTCDEDNDVCVNDPDDAACSNGLFCDGDEVCTPGVGCEPGTALECADDGFACTVESCSELTLDCVATEDPTLCDPGEFCRFDFGCVLGDVCADDDECDDQVACNGIEVCNDTDHCEPGPLPDCDDDIACTSDQCTEPVTPGDPAVCAHTPLDAVCGNGDMCDGTEVCNPATGCEPGDPMDCDDGVACTVDDCDRWNGCSHLVDHSVCEDDSVCNGSEYCHEVDGCQPSLGPLNCASDGIACTTDACSEAADGCENIPDDSLCECGKTCSPTLGCGNHCSPVECNKKTYQCGNCIDDDMDCTVDQGDIDCWGPCHNSEDGWKGDIPGQNNAPCKMDCYFDANSGSGDDHCYWSHECDPLEPQGDTCAYDPDASLSGSSMSCAEAQAMQPASCESFCGPLVPNGCDCFGCCDVQLPGGGEVTVYIGSEDDAGNGTCEPDTATDPTKCHPCTQVAACLNTCEDCELCLGRPELPPGCSEDVCPGGVACGIPGLPPCPAGDFCVTGCCISF